IPASAGMTNEGPDSRFRGNDRTDEHSVVPANAGTQRPGYASDAESKDPRHWIPASAGMTNEGPDSRFRGNDKEESSSLRVSRPDDLPAVAARAILDGEIVLWFMGRLEIGPRALGGRSILARSDRRDVKDRLNVLLKKRVWYQPFCPSMLAEDAPGLLLTEGQDIGDNRFMTMAFRVRRDKLHLMEGVINIDGTCRPHFVGGENPPYRKMLERIKAETGFGVVLNTSFNIHGEPMVCSPAEALFMLRETGIRYLFMEDLLVENLAARD
ncbi:MAG: carbamoyltransferase C-terminal domain-containing protein, partial [Syntrophales bacterium]|nr:carbamoyltransferase C-terminal domain-containing protein [Syntrophales bacterium]